MRLGLCSALSRLWIRLVMKTVLPDRLRPVTASQTVVPPASPLRLLASRSDASAKIGGSQLRLTVEGIRSIRFCLRPPASGAFGPALVGTIAAGSGRRIGLWQAGPERSREGCSCVETRRILPAEAWA